MSAIRIEEGDVIPLSDAANEQIRDFVSQPGYERAKRATGGYSTVFRGTLFGSDDSAEIERRRFQQPVRAIWFGSNPNCPQSLEAFVKDDAPSEYVGFLSKGSESFLQCGPASLQKWKAR